MSVELNGELTLRINDEDVPVGVVFAKPTVVRKLNQFMNTRFSEDRYIGSRWGYDKHDRKKRRSFKEVKELVKLYLLYTESKMKNRKFTKVRENGKTYQPIQGWSFKIMIDHHLNDKGILRFADTFVKHIAGEDKLGYVVFEHYSGENGRYIHLWICDYGFTGLEQRILLKRKNSLYRNKYTKVTCGPKDDHVECVYKSGDYIREKNGDIKVVTSMFATRKALSLNHTVSWMYNFARECVVTTYKELGAERKPMWRFKRLNLNSHQNIKLQQCYIEMNRTQQRIELMFSEILQNQIVYDYRQHGTEGNVMSIEDIPFKLTKVGRELKKIYYRYHKGAFDKKTKYHYTDENGDKVPLIDTRLGRDRLLDNIHRLWSRFVSEIEKFIDVHNLNKVIQLE
ncbi:hypothetical protein [Erysipelothrix anatis]|uniref:hypothetical protein n=1 Tax=Erysipelothrix anatis TaxID=2683713 RepID=UPI00140C1D5E|nr:hypothetical protein [Erysipelothrix anatis]